MARYGQAFKNRAVARLLPPGNASLDEVAREVGVGVGTLERWRSNALSRPDRERTWTAAGRLDAVVTTAAMDEAVVGLAASFGIEVIAEGVEQVIQQEALQAIGVRRMQGWLYGKAMDQESLCRLLGARQLRAVQVQLAATGNILPCP